LPELPNTPDLTLSTCDPVTLKAADPSQREDPNEEPALSKVEGTSAFLLNLGGQWFTAAVPAPRIRVRLQAYRIVTFR
jgi:hypothetical protein